jgi:hypothetical protein
MTKLINKLCILQLIIVSLFVGSVKSWGQDGHMIVAQIAYTQLNTAAQDWLKDQIHIYSDYYPNTSDYLSVAVWADMIRSANINTFTGWHFIDTPYSPDKVPTTEAVPSNIVWALNETYATMMTKNDLWGRGFFIRMLIHLVGDLHQPFHNVALFSKQFPQGDRGGNQFIVTYKNRKTNLHSFWDSICGTGVSSYTFPLSSVEKNQIAAKAQQLILKYGPFNDNRIDFMAWSLESYYLAIQYGYTDLEVGSTLTNNYIQNGIRIAEQQIVKAGYRLALILKKISNLSASSDKNMYLKFI